MNEQQAGTSPGAAVLVANDENLPSIDVIPQRVWPDGAYTLTATAVDSNKQSIKISTEVEAVVDSVDLTGSSPVLSINGQDYTLDKIKRIVRSSS